VVLKNRGRVAGELGPAVAMGRGYPAAAAAAAANVSSHQEGSGRLIEGDESREGVGNGTKCSIPELAGLTTAGRSVGEAAAGDEESEGAGLVLDGSSLHAEISTTAIMSENISNTLQKELRSGLSWSGPKNTTGTGVQAMKGNGGRMSASVGSLSSRVSARNSPKVQIRQLARQR
jgi:hypothetical protein